MINNNPVEIEKMQSLLSEILPIPSQQMITNRFQETQSAGCTMKCRSGQCITIENADD